jgi:hypothetical protein
VHLLYFITFTCYFVAHDRLDRIQVNTGQDQMSPSVFVIPWSCQLVSGEQLPHLL